MDIVDSMISRIEINGMDDVAKYEIKLLEDAVNDVSVDGSTESADIANALKIQSILDSRAKIEQFNQQMELKKRELDLEEKRIKAEKSGATKQLIGNVLTTIGKCAIAAGGLAVTLITCGASINMQYRDAMIPNKSLAEAGKTGLNMATKQI